MSRHADYILVGQGLAGTVLAFELLQRGKRVLVFDEPLKNRSSVISAGICNPITGKAMTPTYAADRIFPFLHRWYSDAERVLKKKVFYPMPIYRPFLSRQEQVQWKMKAGEAGVAPFILHIHEGYTYGEMLNDPFGGLELSLSGYLDVREWVAAVRDLLRSRDMYVDEFFDERELSVTDVIAYRNTTADRIIFCNGLAARESTWWRHLPLRPLKGETLTIRMEFPPERIISRGIYIVPTRTAGEFVVGSTYQHEPFLSEISAEGKAALTERLAAWVRIPVEEVHQDWGIRPTVIDRRPLIGGHPQAENVAIFNGLGTKGVSLAPYFASRLADWMEGVGAIPDEVNISRFKALYSN